MSSANEIRDLNKIYLEAVYGGGKKKEEPKDDRMVVTAADKKANTPAYQKYKAGATSAKTGKPLYKAADHLKNESYETKKKAEVLSAMKKQGRKLSDKDKDKIANKVVTSKGDTSKSDDRYAYEELDHLRALVEKKEVKVKDTKKVVDAIRAYDKSKDASRDATYDTDEGDKEKAAIEKKYAAKERGEIDKDDPNWKKKKYHTGIHGEEVEALKRLIESGKFSDEEIETMAWDIYEADTYAAQLARFEAGRQKRMKASGTYERPKWIPKDQDHSDDYGSSKGKKTTKEGYQRNPEKGEAEERKAERDRKASGRMPPRGDKRREDFEKWYAANVR